MSKYFIIISIICVYSLCIVKKTQEDFLLLVPQTN